jgi:predicted metal-dependent hydrolase
VAKAGWSGDALLLRAPATATRARREAAVRRWYARELLLAAQALLPQCQAAMGVEASALKVRAMRSRWGSCNIRAKVITLALELARRPPEALEYILVHELAHLQVRSHGKRFKGILDRQLPDWRARRKQLNSRGITG